MTLEARDCRGQTTNVCLTGVTDTALGPLSDPDVRQENGGLKESSPIKVSGKRENILSGPEDCVHATS